MKISSSPRALRNSGLGSGPDAYEMRRSSFASMTVSYTHLQLNQFDIVNIVYSMALAGHETTCNTIGSGVLALLRHRDQWQRLIDDPSLIDNAVEEILRYEGPVLYLSLIHI